MELVVSRSSFTNGTVEDAGEDEGKGLDDEKSDGHGLDDVTHGIQLMRNGSEAIGLTKNTELFAILSVEGSTFNGSSTTFDQRFHGLQILSESWCLSRRFEDLVKIGEETILVHLEVDNSEELDEEKDQDNDEVLKD